MTLAQKNHVVQALPTQRSHETFRVAILPWGMRRYGNLVKAHSCDPPPKLCPVDRIVIADQVPMGRRGAPRPFAAGSIRPWDERSRGHAGWPGRPPLEAEIRELILECIARIPPGARPASTASF